MYKCDTFWTRSLTHTLPFSSHIYRPLPKKVSIYSISFWSFFAFAFWPTGFYQGYLHGHGCESTCCNVSRSPVATDGFLYTPNNPWLPLAILSEARPDESLPPMTECSHSHHEFISVMSLPETVFHHPHLYHPCITVFLSTLLWCPVNFQHVIWAFYLSLSTL